MISLLRPENAEAVLDAVRWAAAEETPLDVYGHGSRRSVGRPVQAEYGLDLSGLVGVTLYEPEELVISLKAGTPMASVERLLKDHNQMLAFEPMEFGPLNGLVRGRGTIGGVLMTNASGPRRLKAGAARDHVLGAKAVSGRGEAFKTGGRVVKNVTGYDLSKAMAGSWGTLAVVTEATFKVLPRPETASTLVLSGLSDEAAVNVLCRAMGTPYEVSGAAHLPDALAAEVPDAAFSSGGRAATLIRIEGFESSVEYRAEKLRDLFGRLAAISLVERESSEALWRAIRDAEPFASNALPVWRVSVAPNAGPPLIGALRDIATIRYYYDWSGGLVWIEVNDSGIDALAREIRIAIAAVGGGHATLMRGSPALRSAIAPFEPQPEPLAALVKRLKEQFDPRGILNPGRMTAGD